MAQYVDTISGVFLCFLSSQNYLSSECLTSHENIDRGSDSLVRARQLEPKNVAYKIGYFSADIHV